MPLDHKIMDIRTSPFYECPEKFLSVGDRVVAIIEVYEEGIGAINTFQHAVPGDEGTVVGNEPGYWPTVRFDRTRTATCVTDFEVRKV